MSDSFSPLGFTQSVEIVASPLNVQRLIVALTARIDRFSSTYPGFVGACLQVSEQHDEVRMQLNWRSRNHGEQAVANPKVGEPDLFNLASEFQASAMTFRTFLIANEV
jgi:hypothetical protein